MNGSRTRRKGVGFGISRVNDFHPLTSASRRERRLSHWTAGRGKIWPTEHMDREGLLKCRRSGPGFR